MNFEEVLINTFLYANEGIDPSKAIEDQERKGQLTILEKMQNSY